MRALIADLAAAFFSVPAPAKPQQPVKPTPLPAAVEQGVDMFCMDPEIVLTPAAAPSWIPVSSARYDTPVPRYLIQAIRPSYTEVRRGSSAYQKQWGSRRILSVMCWSITAPPL
jgi:hypothetical protein